MRRLERFAFVGSGALGRFARSILVSTVLALMALPVRAQGAEPAGYREAVEQALNEYGLKNYEEASALFARAHALYPNARTFRGLGMAAFELRRYAESVGYLEAALGSQIKPLDDALRAETQSLLARARSFVATLELRATPPEAALTLDGAPLDPDARPLLLGLGEHTVEARLAGYKGERQRVRVRGGEVLRMEFHLARELLSGPELERPRPVYKSPWLWSGVGAVVVGAAVAGLVLGLKHHDKETRIVPVSSPNTPAGVVLSTLGAR